jgi:phospholipase/carboxylesterase
MSLDSVIVEPTSEHRASVIWLHGLGADGHDFEAIVPELKLDPELGIRFIFPHAPQQAVTINQGYVMRAWYDIRSMTINEDPDREGILASVAAIHQLVENEIDAGVAPEHIILAGFSQGGVIALHTGLRYAKELAGIMSLSSYLPMADELQQQRSVENQQTPLFLAHGTLDPVVPHALGVAARRWLKDLDYPVQWHEYVMEHSVCFDEIADIARWIQSCLRIN